MILRVESNGDDAAFTCSHGVRHALPATRWVWRSGGPVELAAWMKLQGLELVNFESSFPRSGELEFVRRERTEGELAEEGALLRLSRVGRGGEELVIYKLRTMYVGARHLHADLLRLSKHGSHGKMVGDFRVSSFGSLLRRTWLDELPMIMNVLKGQLAPVGLRPVSGDFYRTLPGEVQAARREFKPAFIPAVYAYEYSGLAEILERERAYVEAVRNRGRLRADIQHLARILGRLVMGKIRSA